MGMPAGGDWLGEGLGTVVMVTTSQAKRELTAQFQRVAKCHEADAAREFRTMRSAPQGGTNPPGASGLWLNMAMIALVLLLVLAAGYATQRGSVCAVAATHELVVEHKISRFVGFLFCAACGLAVMAIGNAWGRPILEIYTGLPVSAAALVGGAIVGIGAFVNRRCAFGTVAELGSGSLPRIGTLIGFVAGAALAVAGHTSSAPMVPSPLADLPAWVLLASALGAVVVLGLGMTRFALPGTASEWPPLRSMAIIGVSNGVLMVLMSGWPYTSLLIEIASGADSDFGARGLMAAAFVLGAVVGGVRLGRFKLHIGAAGEWLRAFGGGAIMGVGAVLVPGGNDAMLLVGLPLLLPNLLAAYASMSLTLVALVLMRTRAAARRTQAS